MRPSDRRKLRGIQTVYTALENKRLSLPDRVYILGSGPNAVGVLNKIPEDAFIVAVNRGAEIPKIFTTKFEIAVWVVADFQTINRPYFYPLFSSFEGICVFSERVISQLNLCDITHFDKLYSYKLDTRGLLKEEFIPTAREFRKDCTVAGVALWITFLAGCKEVILVGIDMGGDSDFVDKLPPDPRHGNEWRYRRLLDSQIIYQQKRGQAVYTLSKTNLNNPIREIPDESPRKK